MLVPHNHARGTLSQGYDASATSIVLTTGHGARFPSTGPFRCVWWNQTDYPNPDDDPNREIIEVATRSTDTLTLTARGLETAYGGLAASTKNTSGKSYAMALVESAESRSRQRVNPDREVFFFDDFLLFMSGDLYPGAGWSHYARSSSYNCMFSIGDYNELGSSARGGFMGIRANNSANVRVGWSQFGNAMGSGAPYGLTLDTEWECDVRLTDLSTTADECRYIVGMKYMVNNAYNTFADGIWFSYNHNDNGGRWYAHCRSGASTTDLDTGITVAADTWYRLKYIRKSGTVEFFINGTSVGTISTNLPSTRGGLYFAVDRVAYTTGQPTAYLDWWRITQTFTGR